MAFDMTCSKKIFLGLFLLIHVFLFAGAQESTMAEEDLQDAFVVEVDVQEASMTEDAQESSIAEEDVQDTFMVEGDTQEALMVEKKVGEALKFEESAQKEMLVENLFL